MNILIIKMSSLGDVIHTLPLVAVLHTGIPGSTVDWVVNEEYAGLIAGNSHVRTVIPFRRKSWLSPAGFLRHFGEIRRFRRTLRDSRYDLVIDVQGLTKSAIIVGAAKGRRTMGFSNARELAPLFYSETVFGFPNLHAVERYLLFAEKLGLSWKRSELEFSISVSDDDRTRVDEMLAEAGVGGRFVVFCPFSRWETKMWPQQRFAELAGMLEAKGTAVVWTGAPDERLSVPARHDFTGRLNVRELYLLMRKSRCVVTCDSGAMHVASAADANVFAVFGPTSAQKTGPYTIRGRSVVIRRDDLGCAPCFGRRCGIDIACMDIPADRILREIEEAGVL